MITADFLLTNPTARALFHDTAERLPIIDFHNHIDPAPLAANTHFTNIYQVWVKNDPYKHRAMRIYGIAEAFITGSEASDYDKFLAWAECMMQTVGNPLFHWSCMELQRVFGINELLTPSNARQIWERANEVLASEGFGALDILKKFNVETLCTSDDLLDDLANHSLLAGADVGVSCLPSLRGDSILAFDRHWTVQLQQVSQIEITGLDAYKDAIINRLDFLDRQGCLLSDHSLDAGFRYVSTGESVADNLFARVIRQESLDTEDLVALQSNLLHFLGQQYARRQWKMQLHIGANRFTSTTLRNKLGPAGGYASIGNAVDVHSVSRLLDDLDVQNSLPKTILYTLNPADNAVFASLTGSFSEDGVRGKVQFGPAWWYNDHYEGIVQQLVTLSSYGLLSASIGFTTDSRSILSFSRHEYYRRIVCNLIGTWAEEGKLPDDPGFLGELVSNISYYNIKNWIKK
ncbi:glucuronate isomerase [Dyadobacter sp. CY261]|uniref:glucuronate isomerase n=1 Tax=Dyadobacter sp. CY261 TaxID=2907203 RepID=UPI001F34EF81|nr:glucuronate isomerase [Dyadobacter sp. CY261]MCF0069699.1 glucuronate isomerase [Dyadobacter sp. CY261]